MARITVRGRIVTQRNLQVPCNKQIKMKYFLSTSEQRINVQLFIFKNDLDKMHPLATRIEFWKLHAARFAWCCADKNVIEI